MSNGAEEKLAGERILKVCSTVELQATERKEARRKHHDIIIDSWESPYMRCYSIMIDIARHSMIERTLHLQSHGRILTWLPKGPLRKINWRYPYQDV
jgi:hypothetical protein